MIAHPIDSLLVAKEQLPAAIRAAVLALGAEAIPPLVALLESDEHCDVDAPGEGWAPVHAIDMLVDLEAESAIEPMLRLLRDTEWDAIVHNRIVVRLPELGAPVLEPALRHVEEMEVADGGYDSFLEVLAYVGQKDERIYEKLVTLSDRSALLGSALLAAYGDPRALPLLRRAIAGFNPEFAQSTWRHELGELLHSFETLGGVVDSDLRAHLEALEASAKKHVASTGRVDGIKVGRNDPCPCGTGKKFKKCCQGAVPVPNA